MGVYTQRPAQATTSASHQMHEVQVHPKVMHSTLFDLGEHGKTRGFEQNLYYNSPSFGLKDAWKVAWITPPRELSSAVGGPFSDNISLLNSFYIYINTSISITSYPRFPRFLMRHFSLLAETTESDIPGITSTSVKIAALNRHQS